MITPRDPQSLGKILGKCFGDLFRVRFDHLKTSGERVAITWRSPTERDEVMNEREREARERAKNPPSMVALCLTSGQVIKNPREPHRPSERAPVRFDSHP